MGKPVKISDMAMDLIYLMGRQPHKDVRIDYVGMRPGEKIHEELFNEEIERKTRFSEIMIGRSARCDWRWLDESVSGLLRYAQGSDPEGMMSILKQMLPEGNLSILGQSTDGLQSYEERK
jgi:FlaA1/EpsC-like NDP-sugar epimerase